jgi:hypothetical protein
MFMLNCVSIACNLRIERCGYISIRKEQSITLDIITIQIADLFLMLKFAR